MFMRRRGCALGCGGLLLVCVLLSAATWFVGVPRLRDAAQDGLSQVLSTEIAQEIDTKYSQADLREGQTISVPINTWDQALNDANQEGQGTFGVLTEGEHIVLTWNYQDQSWQLRFEPGVTADGRLNLEPQGDHNWIEGQVTTVLSGGFERAFNDWLDRNGLELTDVAVSGDSLELTVEGN